MHVCSPPRGNFPKARLFEWLSTYTEIEDKIQDYRNGPLRFQGSTTLLSALAPTSQCTEIVTQLLPVLVDGSG